MRQDLFVEDSHAVYNKFCDANGEFWWQLMKCKALYCTFSFVTLYFTLTTKWDQAFIEDWSQFEVIWYFISLITKIYLQTLLMHIICTYVHICMYTCCSVVPVLFVITVPVSVLELPIYPYDLWFQFQNHIIKTYSSSPISSSSSGIITFWIIVSFLVKLIT